MHQNFIRAAAAAAVAATFSSAAAPVNGVASAKSPQQPFYASRPLAARTASLTRTE